VWIHCSPHAATTITTGRGVVGSLLASYLVGDQRIMDAGRPVDEHSNKLGALVTPDGRFALGYAGLAYTPQQEFVTRNWLLSSVLTAAKFEPTYKGILERLKGLTTSTFDSNASIRRLKPANRRLIVIVVGFTHYKGVVRGRLSLLSNYQDFAARLDSPIPWEGFNQGVISPGEHSVSRH
jgi:hypothetical protein